jgi:hypothetical protein
MVPPPYTLLQLSSAVLSVAMCIGALNSFPISDLYLKSNLKRTTFISFLFKKLDT